MRATSTSEQRQAISPPSPELSMPPLRAFIQRHPVFAFYTLVFAISWGGVLLVIGGPGRIPGSAEQTTTLAPIVMLTWFAGPSIAGLTLMGLVNGRGGYHDLASRLLRWRIGVRWYAVALLPAPLVFLATLLPLSLTSPGFLPKLFTTSDRWSLVLFAIAYVPMGVFLEELGWTGFAVPTLRARHDVVATSLIVGVLWGAAHMSVICDQSVPLARPDLLFGLGAAGHTAIVVLEPEHVIGIIVGRLVLQPVGDDSTRLLFRESARTQGPGAQGAAVARVLVWDPAHFVMVHRVLEGIKERAEARPLVPVGVQVVARLGWLLAAAGLLAMFAAHRRWWPWLALPILVLVPPYLATRDLDGALAFGRRWWPAYLLLASVVLLILLLTPDAYAAFGLILFVLAGGIGLPAVYRMLSVATRRSREHIAAARM